jgi:hypothetical protein
MNGYRRFKVRKGEDWTDRSVDRDVPGFTVGWVRRHVRAGRNHSDWDYRNSLSHRNPLTTFVSSNKGGGA